MRDEGPFILDWLACHRAMGFTDFLVYSNDCADGTDAILNRLADMGVLTHLPNQRKGRRTVQWQALKSALDHPLVGAAGWVMVADVDEYLAIHAGAGRLDDLFAARPDGGAFCVPWRMFGNAGVIRFQPTPITAQFPRCAPAEMRWPWRAVQFKTLFRNGPDLRAMGVHRPRMAGGKMAGWVDGNGDPMAPVRGPIAPCNGPRYGLAQLNHYALGAAENFLIKAARGRPNRTDDPIGIEYWIERNFCAVTCDRIRIWDDAIAAQTREWLADPTLSRLIGASIDWRRARINEIAATPEGFRLLARTIMAGPTRVLPMSDQITMLRMAHAAREAAD